MGTHFRETFHLDSFRREESISEREFEARFLRSTIKELHDFNCRRHKSSEFWRINFTIRENEREKSRCDIQTFRANNLFDRSSLFPLTSRDLINKHDKILTFLWNFSPKEISSMHENERKVL